MVSKERRDKAKNVIRIAGSVIVPAILQKARTIAVAFTAKSGQIETQLHSGATSYVITRTNYILTATPGVHAGTMAVTVRAAAVTGKTKAFTVRANPK